jgi:hypothetical protein
MSEFFFALGTLSLVLGLMWFFGSFDERNGSQFTITLADGSLGLSDDFIELELGFDNPEDLETLRHFPLCLANKSAAPLTVNWESCVFIDPDGLERRLVCDALKGGPRPHAVVDPGHEIDALLIPQDRVGGTVLDRRRLLLADWIEEDEFAFTLHLSVVAGEQSRPYELACRAVRVAAPELGPKA